MLKKVTILCLSVFMLTLFSCSESSTGIEPEPPEPTITTGTLEVTASTTGNGTDEDGYSVSINNDTKSIDPNGTATFEEIEEGSYDLELSGLADGCTVDGDNPASVDILAEETATAEFSVNCEFSEAEGTIVFSQTIDGQYEIFSMNADGTNQQQLTDNPRQDNNGAISPDGTKIAFMRQGPNYVLDGIWVMDIDGSNQIQLTSYTSNDGYPTWSPDGTKIAFESDRDGDLDIYVMNADGTNPTQLTNNTAHDIRPVWSPEGDKIMFTSTREGDGTSDIYTIHSDGTGEMKLIDAADETGNNLFDPTWSPDGSRIVYQGFSSNGGLRIFIAEADGSNATMITADGYSSAAQPSWSPDGDYIAFTDLSSGTNSSAIWIVKTDGTRPVRLTDNQQVYSAFPSWGPAMEQ